MSTATKDVIRAEIDSDLKKAFVQTCKDKDISPSQAIRAFVRDYTKKNNQKDMFK